MNQRFDEYRIYLNFVIMNTSVAQAKSFDERFLASVYSTYLILYLHMQYTYMCGVSYCGQSAILFALTVMSCLCECSLFLLKSV